MLNLNCCNGSLYVLYIWNKVRNQIVNKKKDFKKNVIKIVSKTSLV